MKNILSLSVFLLSVYSLFSQPLKTPAPSPTQTIHQDFGLSSIDISYSRPGMKNRKIFGDLVPYGNVWRTGANSATTLTFGDTVWIGGKKISPGKYGLLTIPQKKEWEIIITKQTDVTNAAAYNQDMDIVRINSKTMMMEYPMETFTLQLGNITPTSCDLFILWDQTAVVLNITTDIDKKVMSQIDQMMNKDNHPYFSAAMYYMENGKDLNQSLNWFNKAIELQPDAFFMIHQRANCLAKLGKKKEAIADAEKSKQLALKAKNDDYVRLNDKLLQLLGKEN